MKPFWFGVFLALGMISFAVILAIVLRVIS